jgi:hypothetical protein
MFLPPSEVTSYVESWQRCAPNQVPNLFYAFNADNDQTERVVSYRIDNGSINKLLKIKPDNLIVRMACRPGTDFDQIQEKPPFVPILEAYEKGNKKFENCFLMQWDPEPPFLDDDERSNLSGIDQIPPEGAYLFIIAWLEYQYSQLGKPFEGIAPNLVKRVKSYIFNSAETAEILKNLEEGTENKVLYIHMGIGISVQQHPFSFRPVLQVHDESGTEGDDDGDSFFDFSNPCPPRCGGGDGDR